MASHNAQQPSAHVATDVAPSFGSNLVHPISPLESNDNPIDSIEIESHYISSHLPGLDHLGTEEMTDDQEMTDDDAGSSRYSTDDMTYDEESDDDIVQGVSLSNTVPNPREMNAHLARRSANTIVGHRANGLALQEAPPTVHGVSLSNTAPNPREMNAHLARRSANTIAGNRANGLALQEAPSTNSLVPHVTTLSRLLSGYVPNDIGSQSSNNTNLLEGFATNSLTGRPASTHEYIQNPLTDLPGWFDGDYPNPFGHAAANYFAPQNGDSTDTLMDHSTNCLALHRAYQPNDLRTVSAERSTLHPGYLPNALNVTSGERSTQAGHLPIASNSQSGEHSSSQGAYLPSNGNDFRYSLDNSTLQGGDSLNTVRDSFVSEGDTLVHGHPPAERRVTVQTRGVVPRPSQIQDSLLLDDGKSRSAGFINPTIQKYGGYGIPKFQVVFAPFVSPMATLEAQLQLYPDLAQPCVMISTVAQVIDDVYHQLARLQHRDLPHYADGYYWQYEQAFNMIGALAQDIEDHELFIGHYVRELGLQVFLVGERLKQQDANTELITMAGTLVMRLVRIQFRVNMELFHA